MAYNPYTSGKTSTLLKSPSLPMSSRSNVTQSASAFQNKLISAALGGKQPTAFQSRLISAAKSGGSKTKQSTSLLSQAGAAFNQWNKQREATASKNIQTLKEWGSDIKENWGYYLWAAPTALTTPATLPAVLGARAGYNTYKEITQGFSNKDNLPPDYDWRTYDWGDTFESVGETTGRAVGGFQKGITETAGNIGQAVAAPFESVGEGINEGLNKVMILGLIGVVFLVLIMKK